MKCLSRPSPSIFHSLDQKASSADVPEELDAPRSFLLDRCWLSQRTLYADFFKCKHVKWVWRLAGLEGVRQNLGQCGDARSMVQQVLELKGDTQLKTIFLLNNWWQERNTVREGGQRRQPESLANLCGRQAAEVLELQISETVSRSRQVQKWRGPQPGVLKLNVDVQTVSTAVR